MKSSVPIPLRQMLKRLLIAFDFDHTIIEHNSDVVVRDLLSYEQIPCDVKELYRADGWTAYMGKIFELLHKYNFTPEQIRSTINSIPATPGMDVLLKALHRPENEIIIISDSNSEFIRDWLVNSSLHSAVNSVFTNPAYYDSDNCLKIDMYHLQDWCELSTKNMCKGHILKTYIQDREKEGIKFSKVAYIGDGKNDLCPSLKLSENDLVFPREGYALMDLIEDHPVKASVHPWNTGKDILDVISKFC